MTQFGVEARSPQESTVLSGLATALRRIYDRPQPPAPWRDGANLSWGDPAFGERMLAQHLDPSHGAMYQHANGSRDVTRETFMQMEGQRLDVVLAREDATIYFTKTHIADLRAVIEVDEDAESSERDA